MKSSINYGNDNNTASPQPPLLHRTTPGFAGIAIARTNETTLLYINEGGLPGIVAVRHKP